MDAPRIAVAGAGYFVQFQLEGWRDLDAPVVAIANRSVANAEPLAARFGIPKCYGDVGAMLDAERPALVDLCLPPSAQRAAVTAAVDRGVPVICQKPFGDGWDDAVAMTSHAEAARVPLVIHENFRFAPWFREWKRLIDAGFFGRLHGIAFRLRPGDGQGPRAYLDRQPAFPQMRRFLVRETAVHFIDTFRYLMGEVRAVSARLRRLNPAIAGEDAGIVVFEFDDDRSGVFDGNRLNEHVAANLRRTMGEGWLEGERGVMRLDGDARMWFKPHGGAESEHVYDSGAAGAFGGACTALQRHVLAHLASGAPLENTARDYLANLRVEEAVYRSHASGTRVVLADFEPRPPRGDLP